MVQREAGSEGATAAPPAGVQTECRFKAVDSVLWGQKLHGCCGTVVQTWSLPAPKQQQPVLTLRKCRSNYLGGRSVVPWLLSCWLVLAGSGSAQNRVDHPWNQYSEHENTSALCYMFVSLFIAVSATQHDPKCHVTCWILTLSCCFTSRVQICFHSFTLNKWKLIQTGSFGGIWTLCSFWGRFTSRPRGFFSSEQWEEPPVFSLWSGRYVSWAVDLLRKHQGQNNVKFINESIHREVKKKNLQNRKDVQMPSVEARRRTSTRISENLHKTKLQHWINLNIRENLASCLLKQQEMTDLILLWNFYSCFIALIRQKKSQYFCTFLSIYYLHLCFRLYAFSNLGKLFLCQNWVLLYVPSNKKYILWLFLNLFIFLQCNYLFTTEEDFVQKDEAVTASPLQCVSVTTGRRCLPVLFIH